MRVIDMLNSSRRVFFENAVEGYEYTGRGTGFLCRHREQDFVLTVKHVTEGYPAASIRVLFHPGARDFVPHNAQIFLKWPMRVKTESG